jgi:hypothetical protein
MGATGTRRIFRAMTTKFVPIEQKNEKPEANFSMKQSVKNLATKKKSTDCMIAFA